MDSEKLKQRIGANIAAFRRQLGMTQAELSARSGVPQPVICEIETGKTADPAGSTLYKLSRALRCAMEDLMPEEKGA